MDPMVNSERGDTISRKNGLFISRIGRQLDKVRFQRK